MARLPALIDALSKADSDRERATIANIARQLREDGLLPPSTSGRGATHMSVANAADLLLAAYAEVPRGDAALAAQRLRSLRRRKVPASYSDNGISKELGQAETFGQAIEVLIKRVPEAESVFHIKWNRVRAEISAYPEFYIEYLIDVNQADRFYGTFNSDRSVTVEFSSRTIESIHDALFGEAD